ncbi:MAG: hypothetical protein ACOZNI_33675 [Myxococcota bacterium]
MFWTLLIACAGPDDDAHCESYPEDATPASGEVLDWDTDCGTWLLELDHAKPWAAVSVEVTDEQTGCDLVHPESIDPSEPGTYSALSNDVAKRTFQTYAVAATGGEPVTLDISCEDGHAWSGQFIVE